MNVYLFEDENSVKEISTPCDITVDIFAIRICGTRIKNVSISGKCQSLMLFEVVDYNQVDIKGLIDLEIDEMNIGLVTHGLLKLLELKCKKIKSGNRKFNNIINKYLSEPDPLMRDFEGFKLEMAVNGFSN